MDEVVAALPDDDLDRGNDERFAEAHRSSSGESSDCILCAAQRARGETSASRLCCRFFARMPRCEARLAMCGRWAVGGACSPALRFVRTCRSVITHTLEAYIFIHHEAWVCVGFVLWGIRSVGNGHGD